MAPLLALLDELAGLTRAAGRADLTARLGMSRARVADPRVRLVVVGEPKNGMSTLVNGLVGAAVSATDSPVSVPVIAEYGHEPSATLVRALPGGRTERQPVDPLNPGPALSAEGVIRAEFTEPSALLAEGFVVMDAPGAPAETPTTWSLIAAADAVLYVVEARAEYTPEQIALLQRIQQVCPTVVCVLNKIDRYPHWARVQQRNRELLDNAGLGFAVAPISAELHRRSGRDQRLDMESGVPQLVDHLRDYVLGRADSVARDAAVRDICSITDHLALALRSEAETLRDPRRFNEITERLRMARAEADDLRQRSSNWQVALADGCSELMADIEHDLRHRLRSLIRDTETEIIQKDPAPGWKEFGADLDARICEAVEENFVIAHYRSAELAEQVAAKFPGGDREVQLPDMRLENPGEVLEPVASLEPLSSAKIGVVQPVLNVMRGSYGGLLMVGVLLTALLNMPPVNWYSGAAAVLFGVNAVWEDRRMRRERRQAEAKVAVSRLMDDVIFQVSKESRFRLRAVQRTLRDHFTDLATQTLRSVDESLRAAEEAAAMHSPEGRNRRLTDIENALVGLREVREKADTL
ncbi:50S ribosome-binding GTPase [Nocardia terpenica]|nr:50S ribosome-binding GTPase [Nocardia terpenica]MBF6108444.1 50S ribosome-binding GTPase [Nocardia terpenica]MBF6115908.1 50S ribosome-binding GTPase [Nocardia terpenica]MBF6123038.1 50S ribosome-binding GTPase [Nocardia terpenica]MBF6156288.1 50S ribosome-binding GTPase [Nocardia terpenica]